MRFEWLDDHDGHRRAQQKTILQHSDFCGLMEALGFAAAFACLRAPFIQRTVTSEGTDGGLPAPSSSRSCDGLQRRSGALSCRRIGLLPSSINERQGFACSPAGDCRSSPMVPCGKRQECQSSQASPDLQSRNTTFETTSRLQANIVVSHCACSLAGSVFGRKPTSPRPRWLPRQR